MPDDNDSLLQAITDLIPRLMTTMEAFEQVQRKIHPPRLAELAQHIEPDAAGPKAARAHCRAQESIYPLDTIMSPVRQYFLEPPVRGDRERLKRLSEGTNREQVGEEQDLPALLSMLDYVKSNWNVDEEHILLTGMSYARAENPAVLTCFNPDLEIVVNA